MHLLSCEVHHFKWFTSLKARPIYSDPTRFRPITRLRDQLRLGAMSCVTSDQQHLPTVPSVLLRVTPASTNRAQRCLLLDFDDLIGTMARRRSLKAKVQDNARGH
jgi:hypothetical protein